MRLVFLLLMIFASINLFAGEIYWYAAASAAKPAAEIVELYNKTFEDKLILITGGSGQLLNKIVISKLGDIYSPASTVYAEKAMGEINFVPQKLLKQRLVFGISRRAEDKINSFADLLENDVKIALGNPETMSAGKIFYSKIFPELESGMKKRLLANKLINSVNISQTVNYIKSEVVDAGLLFDSTARANGIKYIEMPENLRFDAFYYIGVTKFAKNPSDVNKTINFIKSQKNIFEKYGFEMAE